MKQVKNIMVAIDMSPMGDEALTRAISVAKKERCPAERTTYHRTSFYGITVF